MILEAIVTTRNADGSVHAAAMGPHVDREQTEWRLKPFHTSGSYANLRRENRAVVHITDDALWLAEVVCKRVDPADYRFEDDFGFVSDRACRCVAVKIETWDDTPPRSTAVALPLSQRIHREFFGWSRSASAIVELAIATTRIGMLATDQITAVRSVAEDLVRRCGDERDAAALTLLTNEIDQRLRLLERGESPGS